MSSPDRSLSIQDEKEAESYHELDSELQSPLSTTAGPAEDIEEFQPRREPTWKDDWKKFCYAKYPALITQMMVTAATAVTWYLDYLTLTLKIILPISNITALLFAVRSSGRIQQEASISDKLLAVKLPIMTFALIDITTAALTLTVSNGYDDWKLSLIQGAVLSAASLQYLCVRQAIEGASYRYLFTTKQKQRRNRYLCEFLLIFVPLFAGSLLLFEYANQTENLFTFSMLIASGFLRIGYEFFAARPVKASWKLRTKNTIGESIQLGLSVVFMPLLFSGSAKEQIASAGYWAFTLPYCLALKSGIYYDSFVTLRSPTMMQTRQTLRLGRITRNDVRDPGFRCCDCILFSGNLHKPDLEDSDDEIEDAEHGAQYRWSEPA